MRKRTRAREAALKILYQIDITSGSPERAIAEFWQGHRGDKELKAFCQRLVLGVMAEKAQIDKRISDAAENWRLARMAKVDRNILRLATFELEFCEDIPDKVTLNEAVELAKKYGDEESSKFVNGVLDQIKKIKDEEGS